MIEPLSVHTHGKLLTTAHDLGLLPGSSVKLDILKLYGFLPFLSSFLSFFLFFLCVYYIIFSLPLLLFWSSVLVQGSRFKFQPFTDRLCDF